MFKENPVDETKLPEYKQNVDVLDIKSVMCIRGVFSPLEESPLELNAELGHRVWRKSEHEFYCARLLTVLGWNNVQYIWKNNSSNMYPMIRLREPKAWAFPFLSSTVQSLKYSPGPKALGRQPSLTTKLNNKYVTF